jgi:transmembrane sensor
MSARRDYSSESDHEATAAEASLWLAKRDRGLTPAEQDEYLRWLGADPGHAEVVRRHAAALERMMQLYEWQPGQSAEANPDLFAPSRRSSWWRWSIPLAAAASIAVAAIVWLSADDNGIDGHSSVTLLQINERQTLSDGSVVELKDGSRLELNFSGDARQVTLFGEAHFTVAKSSMPFVVHAGGVSVRAVGTAFNVRASTDLVDVLVTEGRVAVGRDIGGITKSTGPDAALEEPTGGGGLVASAASPEDLETFLVAGQLAVVDMDVSELPQIRNVTSEEIEMALSWKAPRLQFLETPLSIAVEEFNRRNRKQLVLGQRDLAAIPIGGTFRVDNIDGFVRLLEITLDIRATRRGDHELVLTRGR